MVSSRSLLSGARSRDPVIVLVCFLFRTRGCGCELRTRHSLRPLLGRPAAQLGRIAPRDSGGVCTSHLPPLARLQ